MKGIIFDIDHFAVHDGSGIRTSIFLKGCPLSCTWCHSPESQSLKKEVLFVASRCTACGRCINACSEGAQFFDKDGNRAFERKYCKACGSCVKECSYSALLSCGQEVDSQEVINEAVQDLVFYRNSGGGVTLSGGEILAQPLFTIEILKGLKQHDIHTIVETSGMGQWRNLEEMIPLVNLFYYDLKILDTEKHFQYTGTRNEQILKNLIKLRELTDNIVIRVPLIPGYTDKWENISSIFKLALEYNIKNVHLLPYNPSASAKYEWLGRIYDPGNLTRQNAAFLKGLTAVAPEDLCVKIID